MRQARELWTGRRKRFFNKALARLIFIDETSTNTKLTKRTGWAPKDERFRTHAPFGKWQTQTFIAGLRCHGLVAPWIVNAPMNGAIFERYVETQLAPELSPGDVFILDNVGFHKNERGAQLVRQRGRLAPVPAAILARSQSVYGWLLRVKGIGSGLVNRSVAAMYTASECATGSLRALMNIRLENRSHSIERARGASD
ncbi:transposase [Mesorhizobium sp. M0862]|uniref:transposase n=1 Tax=Mesorhizobium sp. M0862 TaxID=2957015 RepID=UPI0033351964